MTQEELDNYPDEEIILDLSDSKLNPFTLGVLLEEDFGYVCSNRDDNGWQMDFWITYTKDIDNIISMLEVAGTGITFELSLNVILA